jgi:hypothetical protein
MRSGQRARKHAVEPRRGDGVGQIGDDFEGAGAVGWQAGQRVLDPVAFHQVKTWVRLGERGGEVLVQAVVALDGPDLGAGVEQGVGQRAQAGPDLDDGVARGDTAEFEGLADDVAVDEEILPEETLRLMPELCEQVARGLGS